MNLHDKVLITIQQLAIENADNLRGLKPLVDNENLEERDAYDYSPSWEQLRTLKENENPLNLNFVNDATNKVFDEIFGKNLSAISFNLKGHISRVNGHTLKEVDVKYKNASRGVNIKNLKEKLKGDVFLSLIEQTFFDKERMHVDIYGNKYRSVVESCKCPNCDASVYIDFDSETLCFYAQKRLEECPKVNSIMSFTLSVPSKKLVIVNELRSLFQTSREDEYEVGAPSLLGISKDNEMYLKHNIAYVTLSSGGIEVLKDQANNTIALDFDKNTYYERDSVGDAHLREGIELLGDISLELWGCFMLDSANYEKLCHEKNEDPKALKPVYVNIENDVINFTYDIPRLLIEGTY